ncbi:toxin-antitoxin system HicB family antitoxin [Streptoalloteichus hindustanus]|uniref:HicB family protein n=1 Tax=Streptoalloteichus hindustanus TaxID=2017 RepID=A0A1M5IAI3_STRHI|nr:toxin-antitoxin system HicB family antitoxin [Streptoalloteichus hindustanus]SHG24900.1 HicB family protein [Streptoalloteichus hindustanus]
MDLTPYVDNLRRELAVAADAGGEEARALAERLAAPLESAVRLILLNVLSAAADEITRDLAPGSVDLRLRGLDPSFVVTPPPVDRLMEEDAREGAPAGAPSLPPVPTGGDDGATARINFRLPEHLKARVEEAAAREGLSVNTWLVRAVAATVEPDDRSQRPERGTPRGKQHYTGWVR